MPVVRARIRPEFQEQWHEMLKAAKIGETLGVPIYDRMKLEVPVEWLEVNADEDSRSIIVPRLKDKNE